MNHPETSASFRALAESALAFAVGQVLGLGLVAEHKLEAGLGIVLLSPFFVLCLIPACLARLYHEAWRHTLSRGYAYARCVACARAGRAIASQPGRGYDRFRASQVPVRPW